MAAIAGIFLAEELAALDVQTLTLLIVDAFAAAIIGRLKSLPMTFVGGLIIGLVVRVPAELPELDRSVDDRRRIAIPQIMLFLALLFLPQARIEGKKAIRPGRDRASRRSATRSSGMAVAVRRRGRSSACSRPRPTCARLTLAIVTALIMLSLVPLTGWSKQISLAQITFVGAGAFAFLRVGARALGTHRRPRSSRRCSRCRSAWPWRCPALRLQGLYLALASMAFARMADILFFPQPEVLGFDGKPIQSINILGFDFSQPFDFLGIALRPGRRHAALHHRSRSASSACSSCGCTRAGSAGGSPRWATARPRA